MDETNTRELAARHRSGLEMGYVDGCGHHLHVELGGFGLSALSQFKVPPQAELSHVALARFLDLFRFVDVLVS